MIEFNIPNKLRRLTWMTMENTKSQVRIQSDLSDSTITKKGLRQGDLLACLLFNLELEKSTTLLATADATTITCSSPFDHCP